ncbi:hypothetical protein RV420_340040 [Roseovarius sp. EC-SD190]|nr:hypothetical protein RV420_340040 [Roseovarius sp. EC-SD190]
MSKGVEAHARGSFGADLAPARPGLKLIWRAFVANRRSIPANRDSLWRGMGWQSNDEGLGPARSENSGAGRTPC